MLIYYYFDYEQFIDYTRPFIVKAKNGHYVDVIQHAQQVARQNFSKRWILEEQFATIKGFTDIDAEKIDDAELLARQTGFSFLVIFSQFLEWTDGRFRNLGSAGTIAAIIEKFGQTKDEAKSLSDGLNYPTLLGFEDTKITQTTDAQWRNPEYFWLWFRPQGGFRSGWLDVDTIKTMQKSLLDIQIDFTKINIKKLNLPSRVTELTIRTDFALMKELLSYAIDHNKSVYFVLA